MKSIIKLASRLAPPILCGMLLLLQWYAPLLPASEEENEKIGNVMTIFVGLDSVFFENADISRQLQSLLNRLEQANGVTPGTYSVRVLNDSLPNAFSLPNGEIYVTTGLLEALDDQSDVALVLSHEMSHIANGDAIAQFNGTSSKQTAKIVGGSVLAMAMIVATAGLAAGAMGPMGTATTQSTTIINVGSAASTQVLFSSTKSDTAARSRLKFAKMDLIHEPQNHPVFLPALVDAVLKGEYEGYGEEKETAARQKSLGMMRAAGYSASSYSNLQQQFAKSFGDAKQPHLAAYLAERERNK